MISTTTGGGSGLAIAAPLIGLLIGAIFIVMSIIDGRRAKASLTWPSVPGVVVFSGMIFDKQSTDGNSPTPVVTYSYAVYGRQFQSSRVRFNPVKSKKILAQYPRGNAVQVFFDPQKPAMSVLQQGGSTMVGIIVGVAVIIGSCVIGLVLG
jgi:hypothetical protein